MLFVWVILRAFNQKKAKLKNLIRIKSPRFPASVYLDVSDYGVNSVEEFLNLQHPQIVNSLGEITIPVFYDWRVMGSVEECDIEWLPNVK